MSYGQKMHYMEQLATAEQKKKKALIAVCTLGLSQTPIVQLFKDSGEETKQFSFGNTPIGDVFRIICFWAWSLIFMAGIWIVNFFRLIVHAEHCHRLKKLIAAE